MTSCVCVRFATTGAPAAAYSRGSTPETCRRCDPAVGSYDDGDNHASSPRIALAAAPGRARRAGVALARGARRLRRAVVRVPRRAHAGRRARDVGADDPGRPVPAARHRRLDDDPVPVLPRRRRADADLRLVDPLRGLAADLELERQAEPRGQRRLRRQLRDRLRADGAGAAAGLRRDRHRHGPRRNGDARRELRARPSREDGRLGLPRQPRDVGRREGDHEGDVRARSAAVLLHGLLGRRPRGADGSPALPRRLRRHRRRRAGELLDAPVGGLGLGGAGDARQPRQQHPAREAAGHHRGGERGLRRRCPDSSTTR